MVQLDKAHNDMSTVLKSADIACYTAKDLGRDRVHIYRPDDHVSASRLKELECANHIKRSLVDDQFVLYSQNIIPLREGLPGLSEILVRMTNDQQEIK
jgi:predicted signal transduction protein with EAL and GGDEF domain